jgi:uncharacterized damage-inducible protein DinB
MSTQFRTLAAYNRWMNARLYESCSQLTAEQLKRDLGAYFKSIHGTLNHLLLADRIWMGRFTGAPISVSSLSEELFADFVALRQAREVEDKRIEDWVSTLNEESLAANLSYVSQVNPQPRRYPLWLTLAHFFNHQTHHRGQVTTLLSQLGIDPGVTDLIWMPQELVTRDW